MAKNSASRRRKTKFWTLSRTTEIKIVSVLGRVFNLDYQKSAKKINFEHYLFWPRLMQKKMIQTGFMG